MNIQQKAVLLDLTINSPVHFQVFFWMGLCSKLSELVYTPGAKGLTVTFNGYIVSVCTPISNTVIVSDWGKVARCHAACGNYAIDSPLHVWDTTALFIIY